MPRIVVKATRRGINQATKRLQPEELYMLVRASLVETLDILKDIVVRNTPRDSGNAAAGVYTEVRGTSIKDLNGVVASPDAYYSVLEYGRRPGAHMPPEDPIATWAARQGIPADAVYPIRRAIGQRGLPALHIMENALKSGPQHFKTVFLKRWMESWGPDL